MTTPSLYQIVRERPYPDYAEWWTMGEPFLSFMSRAIVGEWERTTAGQVTLAEPAAFAEQYVDIVYGREARPNLVEDFAQRRSLSAIRSGEFDALSYAFFRSAFEYLARVQAESPTLARERHRFCQRVGKVFFGQLQQHLQLQLPKALASEDDLFQLQAAVGQVGQFLCEQGYLRDHFAFRFDVDTEHGGQAISQSETDFLAEVRNGGTGYALYEMGYPAILPSAVYLYHTMGEAQHHSSRTIEDLFESVGLMASETDDFDPTGFSSDMVVELWEVQSAAEKQMSSLQEEGEAHRRDAKESQRTQRFSSVLSAFPLRLCGELTLLQESHG